MMVIPSINVQATTQTITINKAYFDDHGVVDGTNTVVSTPLYLTPGLTTEAFTVAVDWNTLNQLIQFAVTQQTDDYWIVRGAISGDVYIVAEAPISLAEVNDTSACTKITTVLYSGPAAADSKLTYDFDSDGSPVTVDASTDPVVKPKAIKAIIATANLAGLTGTGTLTLTYHQETADVMNWIMTSTIIVAAAYAAYKIAIRKIGW